MQKKNRCSKIIKNTEYTASDELMEKELFWKIIQKTKDSSGGNFEEQQEELANELRKLTADELILFGNSFEISEDLQILGNFGALFILFTEDAVMTVSAIFANG